MHCIQQGEGRSGSFRRERGFKSPYSSVSLSLYIRSLQICVNNFTGTEERKGSVMLLFGWGGGSSLLHGHWIHNHLRHTLIMPPLQFSPCPNSAKLASVGIVVS